MKDSEFFKSGKIQKVCEDLVQEISNEDVDIQELFGDNKHEVEYENMVNAYKVFDEMPERGSDEIQDQVSDKSEIGDFISELHENVIVIQGKIDQYSSDKKDLKEKGYERDFLNKDLSTQRLFEDDFLNQDLEVVTEVNDVNVKNSEKESVVKNRDLVIALKDNTNDKELVVINTREKWLLKTFEWKPGLPYSSVKEIRKGQHDYNREELFLKKETKLYNQREKCLNGKIEDGSVMVNSNAKFHVKFMWDDLTYGKGVYGSLNSDENNSNELTISSTNVSSGSSFLQLVDGRGFSGDTVQDSIQVVGYEEHRLVFVRNYDEINSPDAQGFSLLIWYQSGHKEFKQLWDNDSMNPIWWLFFGKLFEIIEDLRLLFFQYGIVYQMGIVTGSGSIAIYILSWIYVVVVIDLKLANNSDSTFLLDGAAQSQKLGEKVILRLQYVLGKDIGVMCDVVVAEVQKLTGYDQVMVRKFHEGELGEVVSGNGRFGLEPHLGLHYPATDIPQVTRFLFKQNCNATTIQIISPGIIIICNAKSVPVFQRQELKQILCMQTILCDMALLDMFQKRYKEAAPTTLALPEQHRRSGFGSWSDVIADIKPPNDRNGRFYGGFIISVFQKVHKIGDINQLPDVSILLVNNTLEDAKRPIVAAVQELALGVDLEVAISLGRKYQLKLISAR